jgi:hypothetical protein
MRKDTSRIQLQDLNSCLRRTNWRRTIAWSRILVSTGTASRRNNRPCVYSKTLMQITIIKCQISVFTNCTLYSDIHSSSNACGFPSWHFLLCLSALMKVPNAGTRCLYWFSLIEPQLFKQKTHKPERWNFKSSCFPLIH